MAEGLDLPPMVDGPYQGSLDLVLLQPSIKYKLPTECNLSIALYWWGRKEPNILRLNASEEMRRISYNVCCDWKGFRKYLFDLKQLKCLIKYEGTSTNKAKYTDNKLKVGDIIGRFFIRDINLNWHNTVIQDCTILNSNNEICGSITALMFYKGQKKYLDIKNAFISKFISPLSKPENKTSKKVPNNENRSKISTQYFSQEPLLEERRKISVPSDTENKNDVSYQNVEENLMTELLSLVDSGAVQSTDLPLLLQIMEERSPNIDLNQFHQIETDTPMKHVITTPKKPLSDSFIATERTKKPVLQLCDTPEQLQENIPVYEGISCGSRSQQSQNYDCDSPTEDHTDENVRILHLYINSITLNVLDENADHFNHCSPVSNKRFIVKQRSKIGYMIKVSLVNDCVELQFPETFISRQINLGVVAFNCKKFLTLPDAVDRNNNSFLRFSVRSRRMNERLGTDLGMAEFPLRSGLDRKISRCAIWPLQSGNTLMRPIGFITMTMILVNCTTDPHELPINPVECPQPDMEPEPKRITVVPSIPESVQPMQLAERDVLPKKNISPVKSQVKSGTCFIQQNSPSREIVEGVDTLQDIEVKIELAEASSLPVRRLGGSENFYYPNSYVLLSPCDKVKTPIYRGSSQPKWNFAVQCCIKQAYLIQTNNHIILKVYHSLDGRTYSPTDPLLGFVSISLTSLHQAPVHGWFPVLNLEGNVYGKINASISLKENHIQPIKQKENHRSNLPQRTLFVDISKQKTLDVETTQDRCSVPKSQQANDVTSNLLEDSIGKLERFMWMNQENNQQSSYGSFVANKESPIASYADKKEVPLSDGKELPQNRKLRMKAGLNFDSVNS